LQKRFYETFCNYWQRNKNRSEGLFYKKSLCLKTAPKLQNNNNKKQKIMKTKIFFLLLGVLLIATSCATQKNLTPDPSSSVGSQQRAVGSKNSAGSVQQAGGVTPPVYYDGNDEPAVPGIYLYSEEQ
jgi:hypothetical protein